MIIREILPDSIAEQAGLHIGDEVIAINGYRTHDILDYKFYNEDNFISLEVRRGPELLLFEIENDHHESLGIVFDDLKISKCGNDCIFCFVDQNPKGLRDAIYFRDGDYRFSFLYGNFVTLTNVGPKALERIVRLRMSPIYVSVHSTVLSVRVKLMGIKKDDELLKKMQYLHDNGIDMHAQIVLCPGINDGESLVKTVDDMWALRDRVQSLSIVPIGMTDHRAGLFQLQSVTYEYANSILDKVEEWQRTRFKPVLHRNWMYPSDEFYITAQRKLPGVKYYNGFGQVENGVGLSRKFINDFTRASKRFPLKLSRQKKITLATGTLAHGFMKEIIHSRLSQIEGLDVHLEVVENTLFGPSVTVAGLLSGKCFEEGLRGKDVGELVLLPPDTLNIDGLFLDDTTPAWLSDVLHTPVFVFQNRWKDVFDILQEKVRANRLDQKGQKTYLDTTESSMKLS